MSLFAFAAVLLLLLVVGGWCARQDLRILVGRLDGSFLVLATGILGSLAGVVAIATGGRHTRTDAFGGLYYQYSGLAATIGEHSAPCIAIVGLAVIAKNLARGPRNAAAGSALILWGLGMLSNWAAELPLVQAPMLATGFVLAATWLLVPRRDAARAPAVLTLLIAVVSVLSVMLQPMMAVGMCRADKCGPFGVLILGPYVHENALGLFLAMGLPFLILATKGYARILLVTAVIALVWAGGSRSSLAVVLVTVAVAIGQRLLVSTAGPRLRRAGIWTLVLGLVSVGALVPLTTQDFGAYSERGYVWNFALSLAEQSPVIGIGADGWRSNLGHGAVSNVSLYSAHNLVLDVFLTAGIAGLLVGIVFLMTLMKEPHYWLRALPLCALLVGGILERPMTFTGANWLVWTVPALALLGDSSRSTNSARRHLKSLSHAPALPAGAPKR